MEFTDRQWAWFQATIPGADKVKAAEYLTLTGSVRDAAVMALSARRTALLSGYSHVSIPGVVSIGANDTIKGLTGLIEQIRKGPADPSAPQEPDPEPGIGGGLGWLIPSRP